MIKLLHVFRTIFVVTLTINAKYSLLSPWHLKCLSFSQLTKLPRDLLAANYVDIDSVTPLFLIKAGPAPKWLSYRKISDLDLAGKAYDAIYDI